MDPINGPLAQSESLDGVALKLNYSMKDQTYYTIYADGIYFKAFATIGRALTVFRCLQMVGQQQFKHIAWHANHVVTERPELADIDLAHHREITIAATEAFSRLNQTRHRQRA